MSEQIKIRAWDKTAQKMRYNYCGKSGDSNSDWAIFFPEEDDRGNLVFGGIDNPYPRERFVLMLASKIRTREIIDGEEILGSMIYALDTIQNPRGDIFSVVFDGLRFYASGDEKDCDLSSTTWKVVGNVFEP